MNLDELSQFAIKNKTDKWGKHHYTPVYFRLFNDFRQTYTKILEIGVGEGASLRMWRDFFPNAKVFGAEIDPERVFTDDQIEVIQCDQSDRQSLEYLLSKTGTDLDFVIEDGSHLPAHQIFTCLAIMPRLKKNAFYIIEDVAHPDIINQLKIYDCEMLTVGKRYDDRLIIVRHT